MRVNLARHSRWLFVYRPTSAPVCLPCVNQVRRRLITRPVVQRPFARTFLNALFPKPPREIRQPEYEPGWMQIMVWRSRMLDNLRPPPRKELIDSLRKLMQSKLKRRVPLNSTQALQCHRLLEYLTAGGGDDQSSKAMSWADLSMIRQVLLDVEPQERGESYLKLAKSLYAVWSSGNYTGEAQTVQLQWSYLIQMLCQYGGSEEALLMLKSKWADSSYSAYLVKEDRLLVSVACGLAREGKEAQLVELVNYAMVHGVPYDATIQAAMIRYFAHNDKVTETQHWFNQPTNEKYSQPQVYRDIASLARRNNLRDWAVPLILELGQSQPTRNHWDVILQSILLLGKGLAEVEAMMGHMVDHNGVLPPTISTINGLLTVAVETKDPELGEGILALCAERGLVPNGETYLQLFRLRLETADLKGAQRAFEQVKHFEPWNNENHGTTDLFDCFRQCSNSYLTLLSQQVPPDFETILALLDALEEEQMLLGPETVAALCVKFLENEQHFDVIDLLSLHSFHYSEKQREVVQHAFVEFCLDKETSTSRAWGAYQLLRQFFQDTSYELRMKLISSFFDRKRPDMASHLIRHMRQHRNKAYHPTMDTYILYLEGVAEHPDPEGLVNIHNMLKMDTSIQPNTKLYTGLMLAYAACGKPTTSLDFWNEITQSREGPSYASLQAVFWALEKKPGGDKQAREIWERIERMDLEVPPAVYNSYVGAVAGSGNEKEVRGLILNMASYVGSEPDSMTLAIAHNALPGQELQENYRDWAKKKYRATWAELDKAGRRLNEFGLCQIKIKRIMKT
ncbi:Complex I intermediate-associated protein 84 [Metarhizium album ARSEF 1941]|uniref:Complex I intermediate-associated protein 84 n=1 Tax=Metarhizium album (strain ARSEF 1941) TaxID=1081103 RepID=A0A0B2WRF6_METAS|nr:Complex I intermediate-associated protein 84 [Metarhizium album ARSEF 1941]KHN96603.1 Complex I intermediate-associated protein 84 [Metarhizium album ARSEF 1941]